MKAFTCVLALLAIAITAAPVEAKRYRGNCITIEQTGASKTRPTASWARAAALKNAKKLVRADVVKQFGGEAHLVKTILERCAPVNVSPLRQSCRVIQRYCK
jgi:hypothetical protein